ncbi:hypothetical protein [Corynebacterium casei]|uniref:Uncharacterized protein n=1 Tax=Corynebacterium casei LMG S-19264 TaxID=1285583 RepID=A0ABN4CGM2_9CORY|nr:hypothetical protein [Corynebacterium casei]AHI20217.1 hypothetical protein CCASEI_08260 [Corynebacterium casei LMG S-19264]
MANIFTISLPDSVIRRVKNNACSELSSSELLLKVTQELNYFLDKRFEKYHIDELIMELGFEMSRGMMSADRQEIAEAERNGTLISGVMKSNQLELMAMGHGSRIALERAVLASKTGAKKVSAKEVEDIRDVGFKLSTICTLRTISELAESATSSRTRKPMLGSLSVKLVRQGIQCEYVPGDMDLLRWDALRNRPIDLFEINLDHFRQNQDEMDWVHPDLREISDAMEKDLQFSLHDLINVFSWIQNQCDALDKQFIVFEVPEPKKQWTSIEAVRYLTFSDEYISKDELRPGALAIRSGEPRRARFFSEVIGTTSFVIWRLEHYSDGLGI